jgi:hypothetical protein
MARGKLGTAELNGLPGPSLWHADEAGCLQLLTQLLKVSDNANAERLIRSAFQFGDHCQKLAIAKGLDLIDEEGLMVDLAIATAASDNKELFAAVALNNPYPALNFDDKSFNQLVVKALSLDLDIVNIIGLQQRLSETLSEQCMNLVNERLQSDNHSPCTVWLAIDFSTLNEKDRMTYLDHTIDNDPWHRYYSLLGLSQNGMPDATDAFWQDLKHWQAMADQTPSRQLVTTMLSRHC